MRTTSSVGVTVFVVVAVALSAISSIAQDRDPSLYTGLKSCRMCHKKDDAGNQYQKWLDGPHSKTFEILGSDKAKAVGAKVGVNDPQTSPKCLKCHATAYNWSEEVKVEKVDVDQGVVCESCHGPGKNYKSKTVMKSREKCIEGGMIYPATKSCVLCHNDKSPTWDPERYTTKDGKKVGFDAEIAYEKIKHPNPKVKH